MPKAFQAAGRNTSASAYDVMNNWGANHGAISYGHVGADLITLCSMLRIPVCMHNVLLNCSSVTREGAQLHS